MSKIESFAQDNTTYGMIWIRVIGLILPKGYHFWVYLCFNSYQPETKYDNFPVPIWVMRLEAFKSSCQLTRNQNSSKLKKREMIFLIPQARGKEEPCRLWGWCEWCKMVTVLLTWTERLQSRVERRKASTKPHICVYMIINIFGE